jgi:hypothetical protein
MDVLEKLRSNLQHFNNTRDLGDAETVEAIRRHLSRRIRETEGWLRMIESEQTYEAQLRSEAA